MEVTAQEVVVATGRSPAGQRVPISWVDEALERIERECAVEVSVQSLGYRSAFIGAVLRELPGAEVVRGVSPPRIRLNPKPSPPSQTVLLLGCVKLKLDRRARAKDLYRSPLWRGRHAYAESSGHPWFILSARHGLVEPDDELDPYDMALADLTADQRSQWGDDVVAALETGLGRLAGVTFEMHAGGVYRRAIEPGLLAAGAWLEVPLRGLSLGSQLAWYRAGGAGTNRDAGSRRRVPTPDDVRAAVRKLKSPSRRIHAVDWPGDQPDLDRAGLYAWWVDHAGAAALSRSLHQPLAAGLIYAGQAGATKWPSGTAGTRTLASRVGSSHLGGNIRGSTFRLTLAACLYQRLRLVRAGARKLEPPSEQRLSEWMRQHLDVAVLPSVDRDPLADLEHRVLAELDPPLNLDGMAASPVRVELSRLRTGLS